MATLVSSLCILGLLRILSALRLLGLMFQLNLPERPYCCNDSKHKDDRQDLNEAGENEDLVASRVLLRTQTTLRTRSHQSYPTYEAMYNREP